MKGLIVKHCDGKMMFLPSDTIVRIKQMSEGEFSVFCGKGGSIVKQYFLDDTELDIVPYEQYLELVRRG